MVYLNYQYNYLFSSNRYKPFDKVKSDLEVTLNNQTIFGRWENGKRIGGMYYNEELEFSVKVFTTNATDGLILPIEGGKAKIREYMRWQDELKA